MKAAQEESRREFHAKLLTELERGEREGETRPSAVAAALGTEFQVHL